MKKYGTFFSPLKTEQYITFLSTFGSGLNTVPANFHIFSRYLGEHSPRHNYINPPRAWLVGFFIYIYIIFLSDLKRNNNNNNKTVGLS